MRAKRAAQPSTSLELAWEADANFRAGRIAESRAQYRRAVEAGCQHDGVLNNFLCVSILSGRAKGLFRLVQGAQGDAQSTRLCSLLYYTKSPLTLLRAHAAWGCSLTQHDPSLISHRAKPRKLRIGYLSSCFREHSVLWFLIPILANHDRSSFSVYAYSSGARSDQGTALAKSLTDHWRDLSNASDAECSASIASDRIDILVELDGHFDRNRLRAIAARKPAPIVASYLGYPCTTGVSAIDYRITDNIADPPEVGDRYYTEKVERLSVPFLCFHPPEAGSGLSTSRIAPPNGTVFGCFGTLPKLTGDTLRLWRLILEAVPGSSLHLKAWPFGDPAVRHGFINRLTRFGIDVARVKLLEFADQRTDHLRMYREIDIALDTFPYNGTTTTCEALWMGVPVVTLAGQTHHSRVGASLLTAVGRRDLIAESPGEYVEIAVRKGRSVSQVRSARAALRRQFVGSPLCQAKVLVRSLEGVYRNWWCNLNTQSSIS